MMMNGLNKDEYFVLNEEQKLIQFNGFEADSNAFSWQRKDENSETENNQNAVTAFDVHMHKEKKTSAFGAGRW